MDEATTMSETDRLLKRFDQLDHPKDSDEIDRIVVQMEARLEIAEEKARELAATLPEPWKSAFAEVRKLRDALGSEEWEQAAEFDLFEALADA
jgi:hypothetical protein